MCYGCFHFPSLSFSLLTYVLFVKSVHLSLSFYHKVGVHRICCCYAFHSLSMEVTVQSILVAACEVTRDHVCFVVSLALR